MGVAGGRTAGLDTTFNIVMTDFEVLFCITLYRDGRLRIDGKPRTERLPEILRMIALSIESGATVLEEE